MNSTSVTESACERGAAMMPIAPAIAEASTVLAIESWLGERLPSIAVTSFSEAARVANPNRVQRNRAPSARGSHHDAGHPEPVDGDRVPEHLDDPTGNTLGICRGAPPNHSSIVACSTSRMPSEATSLTDTRVMTAHGSRYKRFN